MTESEEAAKFVENELPTHDFVVRWLDMQVPHQDKRASVRVNLFDFGGQPELHSSHRFFLANQRNLYVLTLRADLDEDTNRLDYWLRLICYHGTRDAADDSTTPPIIIVVTHCDNGEKRRLPALAQQCEKLQANYGLKHLTVVDGYDNKTGKGFEELHGAIVNLVSGMNDVFEDLYPDHFFTVQERLRRWLTKSGSKWITKSEQYRKMFDRTKPLIIDES